MESGNSKRAKRKPGAGRRASRATQVPSFDAPPVSETMLRGGTGGIRLPPQPNARVSSSPPPLSQEGFREYVAHRQEVARKLRALTDKWASMDVIPDEDLDLFDLDDADDMLEPCGAQVAADLDTTDPGRVDVIPHERIRQRVVKVFQEARAQNTIEEEQQLHEFFNRAGERAGVKNGVEPIVLHEPRTAEKKPQQQENTPESSAKNAVEDPAPPPPSKRQLDVAPMDSLSPVDVDLDSAEWRVTLEQPPGRLLPADQRQILMRSGSVENLERYLNRYRTFGKRLAMVLSDEQKLEEWKNGIQGYTGALVCTLHSQSCDRLGLVYYVERPVFVCFVFRREGGGYRWDGYAYIRGKDKKPPTTT